MQDEPNDHEMISIRYEEYKEMEAELERLKEIISAKFEGETPFRFEADLERKVLIVTAPTMDESKIAPAAEMLSKALCEHIESAGFDNVIAAMDAEIERLCDAMKRHRDETYCYQPDYTFDASDGSR